MDTRSVQHLLRDLSFTAIDFELANERWDSICSIGIVSVKSGKVEQEQKYLVRPKELRVTLINQHIHRLCEADLQHQPELNSIWEEIAPYFERQILVAHNASFDINALRQTLTACNIRHPKFKYMCSQKLAQEAFSDLLNYRLSDVAQYLGLDLDHHDALADARMAAEIAIRSIPKIRHSDFSLNHEELTFNIEKIASQEKKDTWTNLFANKKIDRDLLEPDLNVANKENIFYNKRVVFTGDLTSIDRQDAAEKIKKLGADINTAISKRTDIVIVGQRPGPSKMKKISDLRDMGYNIRLINEDEFLALLAEEIN